MDPNNVAGASSNLLLQFAQIFISALTSKRFFSFVKSLFGPRANHALYEILDYDLTLDLKDKEGRQAIFRRSQRVRFLQDHVIAYQDEAWGDGEVVTGYKCSPGVPVDTFKIGSRYLILISLRQAKNRGDVVEFQIEREVKNGFVKKEEWLETETRYPTRRLRMTIIFPRGRPCIKARLVERRADRTTSLGTGCFGWTKNGRQTLTWESKRPAQLESYTICWTW